jgi:hypothetical protein
MFKEAILVQYLNEYVRNSGVKLYYSISDK